MNHLGQSPTVRVETVSRIYTLNGRQNHALTDVTLQAVAGEFIALRGRSGSGKTTLLNCIGGLDKPTNGRIWVAENEVTQMSEAALVKLRRQGIGFVFQAHALLPTFSARENVDLMLRLAHMPRAARKTRSAQVLALVGLDKWMDHRPYELSGGQQQRVAIARAIATHPTVILADEPTGELDTRTGQQILQMLKEIAQQEQTTVLIATHDLAVDAYADTVYHLENGRITSS